jgi:hypothetical protein
MAIKIKIPIGTNQGIVTNAYVRLSSYNISKDGKGVFTIDIFKDKESTAVETSYIPPIHPNKLESKEIGVSLNIKLEKRIEYKKLTTKLVDDIPTEVEDTFYKKEADLSIFETKTIFEFGYEKLNELLSNLYGAENLETV